MNASVEWLASFVESGLSAAGLRDLITARVATVDAVEPMRTDLGAIVVGHVIAAAPHPDSDHLWVTKVDAGGPEPLDVVCGAPNVAAGVRYPFAPVGTTMPSGMKIERRKIRGQMSNGMLCSARELGLGTDHAGVLALTTDAAPGTPLLEAMQVGDTRLVVDVMPNRPDLLSHVGLAREIAAGTGRPLHADALPVAEALIRPKVSRSDDTGDAGGVRITVEDREGCSAYLGVVIRNVHIGPSPEWLVNRLLAAGVSRSINNIVDVTNYLLHGYGQPAHAFDLARLSGREIRVRRARAGERLTTLDGVLRTLDPAMLVIADAERAQGVAGVIGGQESEITSETRDIFLELATFDAKRVRSARRALGISTDASFRFERVVPVSSPEETLAAAVTLLVALTGGVVAEPVALVGGVVSPPTPIRLRASRVAQVLGVPVPASECAALLQSVGFATVVQGETVAVTAPTWRVDAQAEIDLVEEVARLRGYDTFPDSLRPYRLGTVPDDPVVARTARLRELLVGRGFLEVRPMPFVSTASPSGSVRVSNPLADTEAYLRGDVLPSLARCAEYNLSHMEGDLRLFEVGTVFHPTPEARPREEVRVAALCMGARRPPHFTEPEPPTWNEWDAKALGEAIVQVARSDGPFTLQAAEGEGVLWEIRGRDAVVGQVRRVPIDGPPWAAAAFGAEVTVAVTETAPVAAPGTHAPTSEEAWSPRDDVPRYAPPPVQPAVRVDVTLLLPDGVSAASVERVMGATRDALLVGVDLQSEYRGSSVPPGHRSVTWRLTFRHPERTLREKEVEARRDKLLRALESELGVRQRTA